MASDVGEEYFYAIKELGFTLADGNIRNLTRVQLMYMMFSLRDFYKRQGDENYVNPYALMIRDTDIRIDGLVEGDSDDLVDDDVPNLEGRDALVYQKRKALARRGGVM